MGESQKKLTAQRLAAAIREAVDNDTYRQRVAQLGEKIRAEDSVGRAVEWISARLSS